MYKLRLRLATFADALGVYGSQLIPWHCYVVFYAAISNAVFPIYTFLPTDIIRMNIMGMVASQFYVNINIYWIGQIYSFV